MAMLATESQSQNQTHLFWQLVVEIWRYCVRENITTLYMEMTPRALPLCQWLGWPLDIVGERRLHWGEECYLCTLSIPEVARAILQRAEDSPYYRQIATQAFRLAMVDRGEGPTPGEERESFTKRFVA